MEFQPPTTTAGEMYQTLKKLGDTPRQIRQTLANKGVRGKRHASAACPLTRYLQEQGFERARVGSYTLWVDGVKDGGAAEMSRAMSGFVKRFDQGLYPELEA